jgi:putative GTP pyrophosphokinase
MNEKVKTITEEEVTSIQEYSPKHEVDFQLLANSDTGMYVKNRFLEFSRLMSYYKCAIMEIETKLNVLNVEYSLSMDRNPINSVKSRLKSLPSIFEKLERRELPRNMQTIENELNDIAGIRVICSFIDDVYLIAEALLKQDDIVLIEKKDYIKNPKPNGYRSLHLIVSVPIFLAQEKRIMKVEIQ